MLNPLSERAPGHFERGVRKDEMLTVTLMVLGHVALVAFLLAEYVSAFYKAKSVTGRGGLWWKPSRFGRAASRVLWTNAVKRMTRDGKTLTEDEHEVGPDSTEHNV